jgi:tetratricopeptide (TPR) repeat protein
MENDNNNNKHKLGQERVPTVCLNMIVKNESKIITRMLDAVIDIIDSYCICDTGSTDETVNIIQDYFSQKNITGKIMHEPFKNFSHNRNVALQGCKGMSDYVLLLDADMILKVSEKFDKKALTQDFYFLFQGSELFYYQNVRIVRNTGLFSYIGVTHEYLNTPPRSVGGKVFDKKVIFVLDVGDGGAKSDKFKRDITLLEKGLEDEPTNTRYYFYLGNSYRDYGEHDKAIETYKKQLSMMAWDQEKYCACVSIGNIYQKKGDMHNAAKYWLKTCEYDNERIEGVVKAMDYYRNEGENLVVNSLYNKHKGYKKNLAEGKLFVEQDKYRDQLEYNNSISAYYVNDKESGYTCCKDILLHSIMSDSLLKSTLENMRFYKDQLAHDAPAERHKLFLKVDSLLEKLCLDKKADEVWSVLHMLGGEKKDTKEDIKKDTVSAPVSAPVPVPINIEETYQRIKQCRIDGKCEEAYELYQSILHLCTIKSSDLISSKGNSYHELEKCEGAKYSDYLWKLAYEYSVFAYYVGIRNVNDSVVTILNNCPDEAIRDSVLSNMKFYYDVLTPEKVHVFTHSLKHTLNGEEYNFNSSSSCIIPYGTDGGYLLNVRLVNYHIEKKDVYVLNGKHIVSMYKVIELTKDFETLSSSLIDVDYIDRRYIGVEDVRFFKDKNNRILFTGTGYHKNNTVGVTNGKYSQGGPLDNTDITPAFNTQSTCEKNWVFVNYKNETHMIYNWYPLKICKTDATNTLLELVEEKNMPAIFKYARGSSCGIEYNNEIWFIVHLVSYETRDYYHMIAVFDKELNLKRYSAPFKHEGEIYEYCIGLAVEEDRVVIPYSTMDRTTKVAVYDKKYIESKLLYTCSPRSKTDKVLPSNTVLFFTAFKDLGRDSWGQYSRSVDLYLSWFANLTKLPIKLICYCEEEVATKINTSLGFTQTYPYDIEHTFYGKYNEREKTIFESDYFKQLTGHRLSPECRNFGYNLVNHNKYSFLKRTKENFPNYTHYAWIDFGYCRTPPSTDNNFNFNFNMLTDKILFSAFHTPRDNEDTDPVTLCINPKNINPFNIIQGSAFIVNNEQVEWLHDEYEKIMLEYYDMNLIDQDQAHILQLYKKYPDRFDLHITSEWFTLLNDLFAANDNTPEHTKTLTKKPVLVVTNLWWPFGAHLLHIKWAYIYALQHGLDFFYKYNTSAVFPKGSIEHYYENLSTVDELELRERKQINYSTLLQDAKFIEKNLDIRGNYVPEEYTNPEDFHSSILKKIYKPNKYTKYFLDNNCLLKQLKERHTKYFAIHLRLGDKVDGDFKETNHIPLITYLNECRKLREVYNINTIVICSDTSDGLDEMIRLNNGEFDILFNDERRSRDDWKDSFCQRIINGYNNTGEIELEYLNCFVNCELLLNAEVIVGNWDSIFCLVPVEIRNNKRDINVSKKLVSWGIRKPKSRANTVALTDKQYNNNEVKICVSIGSSETNTKIIDLHYFPDSPDFDYNIKLHKTRYKDRFHLYIVDGKLTVTRVDEPTGWGHAHSCDIIIQRA